jgi:hypothetical protein
VTVPFLMPGAVILDSPQDNFLETVALLKGTYLMHEGAI